MAGIGHHLMTRAAFAALPAWQRERWADARERLVAEYCAIPDLRYNSRLTRRFDPYCRLPNGRLIPHALANERFNSFPLFTRDPPDLANNLYIIRHYLQTLVRLLRAGSDREAAIYAGTFAHYLEDAVWPAHAMENSLFYELLPRPRGKYWQLHRVLDGARPALAAVRPALLGANVREATFHLYHRLVRAVRRSTATIVPCLQAIRRGDPRSCNQILVPVARDGAFLVSSAWYTAFTLAFDRATPAEIQGLQHVRLADLPPVNRYQFPERLGEPLDLMSHDPYLFAPLVNEAVDGTRQRADQSFPTIPLAVSVRQGSSRREAVFRHGFAAAGISRITFHVDGRLFDRFEATIGMHRRIASPGRVRFRVSVSRDLRKFIRLYESGPISSRTAARLLSLRLPPFTKYLLLETIKESPAAAPIVWGNPTISRRKAAGSAGGPRSEGAS